MADRSRKRAENTLAVLAMVGTMITASAAGNSAVASDRLGRVIAPVVVGAAIYYGMTHGQRSHVYDRGYYFDPAYFYFDGHRGQWRARSHHQRSHRAQQHYRQNRHGNRHASRHDDRRSYSSDRGHSGSHDRGRSRSRNNGNNGRRGHDDHNQSRDHGGRGH